MSLQVPGIQCSTSYDCGGVSNLLRTLHDADVKIVMAAGNLFGTDVGSKSCKIGYPASSLQGFAVGNIRTMNEPSILQYESCGTDSTSAWGGMPITTTAGTSDTAAMVGIGAPGCARMNASFACTGLTGSCPGAAQNYYDETENGDTGGYATAGCGTSFAAPIVTGTVANLLSEFQMLGWPYGPEHVYATLLTYGDAYDPGGAGLTAKLKSGLSNGSGAGRLHAMRPTQPPVVGWGVHWVPLSPSSSSYFWWVGNSGSGKLANTITQWKLGATWHEVAPQGIADIDFYVWDRCVGCSAPGQPGCTSQQIAAQNDYDFRNRIQLQGPDVQGRCLQVEMRPYNVPQDGRTVWAVDWIQSGDPN